MTLSENIIKQRLQEEYNSKVAQYGKNKILGVFLLGRGNYGFVTDESQLEFYTVYLPSFNELCEAPPDFKDKYFYDIRYMYGVAKNKSLLALELLFTDYYIITEKYKKLFNEYFLSKREELGRMYPKARISRAYYRALNAANSFDYFEAMRLVISARLYINGESVNDCFHLKDDIHKEYLWGLVNKKSFTSEEINKIRNSIEEIGDMIEEEPELSYNSDLDIKKGVVAIMAAALQESASIDTFLDCLTDTEKIAWKAITNKLVDGTAIISISKIIEETNISRPVYKNLLLKMEQNKIATITNMGVKGTRVELYE